MRIFNFQVFFLVPLLVSFVGCIDSAKAETVSVKRSGEKNIDVEINCNSLNISDCRKYSQNCIWYYSEYDPSANASDELNEEGKCVEKKEKFYLTCAGNPFIWGILLPTLLILLVYV
jgi:hypothetical protein